MLEIHIESVEILAEQIRNVSVSPVVINLQSEIRAFGKRVGPATDYIIAVDGNV